MNYRSIASALVRLSVKVYDTYGGYEFPWRNPFDSEVLSAHGVEWIEFNSAEETPPCNLTGWACRPASPAGTVYLLHGFREHSYNASIVDAAERFVANLNLAVVAPDFRYHGQSENKIPSFGYAESLDVSGAMNWAEDNGYPGPYLMHGASLGALAGQICAIRDSRVAGAFLKSCPASASVALAHGIQHKGEVVRIPFLPWVLRSVINAAYGYDVIHWGSVQSYPAIPEHRPSVFYTVGDHEEYGYDLSRSSFDHWYQGKDVEVEVPPSAAWDQAKWFRTAWGGHHDFGDESYPEMEKDVDDFFRQLVTP